MTSGNSRDSFIHLLAGGIAGTTAAIVTCPLEVVKTRLQSSVGIYQIQKMCVPPIASNDNVASQLTCKSMSYQRRRLNTQVLTIAQFEPSSQSVVHSTARPSASVVQCLRYIVNHEGPKALFRGLVPNLIGVAPSRAIYFCAYSQSKKFWNNILPPDTALVHVFSAACAGFSASSVTNPIWFVKTRLQLAHVQHGSQVTAMHIVRRVYLTSGIKGFYKGITASYFGITETIIHFVIYEAIKAKLMAVRAHQAVDGDSKKTRDFVEFMMAGAVSKTCASCIAYPHEVARTRLREEGSKYRTFFQTLGTVAQEEGYRGLYRGLSTQLIRQIPNTAIMMATYEAVVYVLTSYYRNRDNTFYSEDDD